MATLAVKESGHLTKHRRFLGSNSFEVCAGKHPIFAVGQGGKKLRSLERRRTQAAAHGDSLLIWSGSLSAGDVNTSKMRLSDICTPYMLKYMENSPMFIHFKGTLAASTKCSPWTSFWMVMDGLTRGGRKTIMVLPKRNPGRPRNRKMIYDLICSAVFFQ